MNRALPFLLSLAIPITVIAGGPAVGNRIQHPIRMRVSAGTVVLNDVADTIQKIIRMREKISVFKGDVRNLPPFVLKAQIDDPFTRWKFGNIRFLIVQQRNFITYLDMQYEDARWAGVLVSKDNGMTWDKFFTITNPIIDFGGRAKALENPVNVARLFVRGGMLYLDITDGHGGGSGEGRLTRLRSRDGGRTWQRITCLYFMPEDYYPTINSPYGSTGFGDRSTATPFNLHTPVGCSYP